jgi:hypothetical protein
MKEFIETERTDGDKLFTYEGALKRIKALMSEDKLLPSPNELSNDDLIEIGFRHFGFNYVQQ